LIQDAQKRLFYPNSQGSLEYLLEIAALLVKEACRAKKMVRGKKWCVEKFNVNIHVYN